MHCLLWLDVPCQQRSPVSDTLDCTHLNAEPFQQGCQTDDLTFTALIGSYGEKHQP
jgi:hypothetical protein